MAISSALMVKLEGGGSWIGLVGGWGKMASGVVEVATEAELHFSNFSHHFAYTFVHNMMGICRRFLAPYFTHFHPKPHFSHHFSTFSHQHHAPYSSAHTFSLSDEKFRCSRQYHTKMVFGHYVWIHVRSGIVIEQIVSGRVYIPTPSLSYVSSYVFSNYILFWSTYRILKCRIWNFWVAFFLFYII